MKRILSAVVFLPLFIILVRLPPPFFSGLVALASVVGLQELYRMASARGVRCHRLAGTALALITLYSFYDPRLPLAVPVLIGVVGMPLLSLLGRRPLEERLGSDAVSLFGALFVGILFGYQVSLRGLGHELGRDLIFLLFFVVWIGDAAAYYLGSSWGRIPLTPRISPRKTVEGALAGVAGSLIAALLASKTFFERMTLLDCLGVGFLLSVRASWEIWWSRCGSGGRASRTARPWFPATVGFWIAPTAFSLAGRSFTITVAFSGCAERAVPRPASRLLG